MEHSDVLEMLRRLAETESVGKWGDSKAVRAATECHPTYLA